MHDDCTVHMDRGLEVHKLKAKKRNGERTFKRLAFCRATTTIYELGGFGLWSIECSRLHYCSRGTHRELV